jgi:hypothetical protein
MLTRMATKRLVRDPAEIKTNNDNPSEESLAHPGMWEPAEFIEMDAAFVAAMTRNGYQITTPSSRPGTKAPLLGYRRADD